MVFGSWEESKGAGEEVSLEYIYISHYNSHHHVADIMKKHGTV